MYSISAIQKFIQQLVRNSGVDVVVLDNHYQIICNTIDDKQRGMIIKGIDTVSRFSVLENWTYMKFNYGEDILYVGVKGTDQTAQTNCCFYAMLLEMYSKSNIGSAKTTKQEFFKRLIKGQLVQNEFIQLATQFNILIEKARRAIVVHVEDNQTLDVFNVIDSAFSEGQAYNLLFCYSPNIIVFVVEVTDETDDEYFYQMGEAIYDSVEREASIAIKIGIGNVVSNLSLVHESFEQGEKALHIGKQIRSDKNCLMYEQLTLELFLSDIPKPVALEFSERMNNPEYKKLLNEEMLLTINKFFENNLNLSETARQLFIHRNTLVYRLDKIQRITHLDLRNFHDAVSFKLMMILKQIN